MIVYDYLLKTATIKQAGFLMLLDPDRIDPDRVPSLAAASAEAGVDAFLIGTSLLMSDNTSDVIKAIKKTTEIPAILFPGNWLQITPEADAILFLSLISGRNPDYLITEQVRGAPLVKSHGIEPIPTGYILVESGKQTSVEYISDTHPVPRDKYDIAKVHALAGEYLGMKLIYLEAGSGATESVPDEMVTEVSEYISRPVIVGGGIVSPDEANRKVMAGASFVVIGNHFEKEQSGSLISEFADAIHVRTASEVLP
ncbi:MAG: geranylgeranylglyceryl/heptaprenylglyceryl phosphate synthase [Candidatus Zixiibacteriota bacterium]